jgi:hypothetical protein
MGSLVGPGAFRRGSFRTPPTETATNIVMASGKDRSPPEGALIARRCRVLRPSSASWVIELDLGGSPRPGGVDRRWISVRPQALLGACASRLGGSRVTPTGPIVPWLLLDGVAATRGQQTLS